MKKLNLFFGLIMISLACGNNNPEQAVDGFLASLRDGDYRILLEKCPNLDSEIGFLTESEIRERIPAQPNLEWEIIETELAMNGHTAQVVVQFAGEYSNSFFCQLVDDVWIVQESESAILQNSCRINLYRILEQEVIYHSSHAIYTNDLQDLFLGNLICPTHGEYIITADANQFLILCPSTPDPDLPTRPGAGQSYGGADNYRYHGYIRNGEKSWSQ